MIRDRLLIMIGDDTHDKEHDDDDDDHDDDHNNPNQYDGFA